MSLGPATVRVKRKRNEPGPDRLILESELEPQRKRTFTVEDAVAAKTVQYVKVLDRVDADTVKSAFSKEKLDARQQELNGLRVQEKAKVGKEDTGRVFHLTKTGRVMKPTRNAKGDGTVEQRADIATFEESRSDMLKENGAKQPSGQDDARPHAPTQQKRPGRAIAAGGAKAAQPPVRAVEDPAERQRIEVMAASLHSFALDELANAQHPVKVTTLPKHPARRRNVESGPAAITEPRIREDIDMDPDPDSDYVYDTYILASTEALALHEQQTETALPDIGYLVITTEDRSLWEAYIEDEPSDREWDTDDEDENAEDYYGADYPEDELASDDEFGRGAYGYRAKAGSDGEEWDEETGAYSDDEAEDERRANPWKLKTPQQFAAHDVDDTPS
ncbi:hypothetical protein LTR53_008320 [Teratosphaeriaceae sp. CCFEE 6253]|nr:hypothetical protein LTR53_008320 [Teratosphaeriaceae sp. CCFEE 6253]